MSAVHSFFNNPGNYLHRRFGIWLRVELVSGFLGELENKRILDAGCGDGSLSINYLQRNNVVFCDVAENMLKIVEKRIPEQLKSSATLYHGPLEKYSDISQFDVILCVGLLAHVNSVERTIGLLSKMLKVKGKIILQFSDAGHWLTALQLKRANYGYNINKIYYNKLLSLCNTYGLVLKNEVRYQFSLPGMGKLPDKISYQIQKRIMRTPILSRLCTDYMWFMEKVN